MSTSYLEGETNVDRSPGWKGNPSGSGFVVEGRLESLGYERITGLGSVQQLTVPTNARIALIQCEGQAVRWRDDGANPTAAVGMRLLVDQDMVYSATLSSLRFIEVTAGATLNVSYYR